MVAYTTTYNLKKPTVADDEDVWGGYLNDSMDIIDDVLDGTVPVTGIDINSGTLDDVVIGGSTANTGTFTVLSATTSLGVTGNITVSGTVDGRDVATDGTKLDGIESGATADQTKADIDALGIAASTASTLATARNIALTGDVTGNVNFDGSGNVSITTTIADDSHNHVISNVDGLQTALDGKLGSTAKAADSNLLDGIDSGSFVRSDANDTVSGQLNLTYGDQSLWSTHNGNSSGWRGRMGHRNSTADTSIYLGSYGNNGGVFSHNYALNAWDDLFVNTADGSSGGNVRLPSTTYINGNTVWHAGNDGSGSGLDADTVDGIQASSFLRSDAADSTASTISFTGDIEVGNKIAHHGDTDTFMQFGNNQWNVYVGNSREITVDGTGVRLGDTGNGYFRPVSGSYGSIEIDGGAHTGYEGYSIGGESVFMSNGSRMGLYDDTNNEWAIFHDKNGEVQLHYNGSSKLQTTSSGVNIDGNLNAVDNIYLAGNLYHEGDTDTRLDFGTNTINLRAGNQHEVIVNTYGLLLVNSALHEDYDALSGTSPSVDPNAGGAFSLTMSGNTTFTFGGTISGYGVGFIIQLTGNGGTVLWPTSVDWAGGTAPDAPASGETDIYVFWTRDGGTTWYGVQSIDAAA